MTGSVNRFLQLNRHKAGFAFLVTSVLLLSLVTFFLIAAYFTGSFPGTGLLIMILLFAIIIMPFFIVLISFLGWLYVRSVRQKSFSKRPFDQIGNIGFSHYLLNKKTKWRFTDEIKIGKINGFTLLCDISNANSHMIEIEAVVKWRKIDKSQYEQLTRKFRNHHIEFRIGSLVQQYSFKRLHAYTIVHLERDLQQFTELLKQEGFQPREINESPL